MFDHSQLIVTKCNILFQALGGNKQALEEAATVSDRLIFEPFVVQCQRSKGWCGRDSLKELFPIQVRGKVTFEAGC